MNYPTCGGGGGPSGGPKEKHSCAAADPNAFRADQEGLQPWQARNFTSAMCAASERAPARRKIIRSG